jgi:hypothetical protein
MAAGGSIRHTQGFGSFGQAAEFGRFGEHFQLEQAVHCFANRKRDLRLLTFISVSRKSR